MLGELPLVGRNFIHKPSPRADDLDLFKAMILQSLLCNAQGVLGFLQGSDPDDVRSYYGSPADWP